jgi:hypothetical protein
MAVRSVAVCGGPWIHPNVRALQRLAGRTQGLIDFTQRVHELVAQKAFKGNVFGPVATEIKIRPEAPPHAAAALEVAIANRIMSMFIVEQYEDQDKLRGCAPSVLHECHLLM